jgi:hypothetical protein
MTSLLYGSEGRVDLKMLWEMMEGQAVGSWELGPYVQHCRSKTNEDASSVKDGGGGRVVWSAAGRRSDVGGRCWKLTDKNSLSAAGRRNGLEFGCVRSTLPEQD